MQFFSCGYGKANIDLAQQRNELIALAKGVYAVTGVDAIVLDIGGQDTKIIIEKKGCLKEFFINDKCAAGCGQFLTNTLNMLDSSFESIDISDAAEPEKNFHQSARFLHRPKLSI